MKLKPCPFCGCEAVRIHEARRKVYGSEKYVYGDCVYCPNCDAEIFSSINKAAEMWNRREGEQDGHNQQTGGD